MLTEPIEDNTPMQVGESRRSLIVILQLEANVPLQPNPCLY